jgi:hypothetical protein
MRRAVAVVALAGCGQTGTGQISARTRRQIAGPPDAERGVSHERHPPVRPRAGRWAHFDLTHPIEVHIARGLERLQDAGAFPSTAAQSVLQGGLLSGQVGGNGRIATRQAREPTLCRAGKCGRRKSGDASAVAIDHSDFADRVAGAKQIGQQLHAPGHIEAGAPKFVWTFGAAWSAAAPPVRPQVCPRHPSPTT